MAIDTAAKRKAAAGMPLPLGPNVTPDSTPGAAWRQTAAYTYSGIAAAAGEPEPRGRRKTWHYRGWLTGRFV